jgi:hypothetical protein
MDYIKSIKKIETPRPVEMTEAIELPVKNKKFKILVDELSSYADKITKKTGKEDTISKQMLDQMRLVVLAKHFEKEEKKELPTYQWFYNKMLSNAKFRSYCGANTPILKLVEEDRDLKQPYKIDSICKIHDYDYTKAQTMEDIHEADAKMIKSIFTQYVSGEYQSGYYKNNEYKEYENVSEYLINNLFEKTLPNLLNIGMAGYFAYNTYKNVKSAMLTAKTFEVTTEMNEEAINEMKKELISARNINSGDNYDIEMGNMRPTHEILKEYETTHYLAKHAQELRLKDLSKNVISTMFYGAMTGLLVDTIFTAITATAIGIKMITEKMTGFQFTSTLDEYNFDPFDIENNIKQFLEAQQMRAEEAKIEIEPFRSSIGIENIVETQKEKEVLNQDSVAIGPEIDPLLKNLYEIAETPFVEIDPLLQALFLVAESEE